MPKFPMPWFRKKRGWYVTLDGGQIPLGKDRDDRGLDRNVLESRTGAGGSRRRHRLSFLLGSFQERCQLFLADPNARAAMMAEFARFHQVVNGADRAVQAFGDLRNFQHS